MSVFIFFRWIFIKSTAKKLFSKKVYCGKYLFLLEFNKVNLTGVFLGGKNYFERIQNLVTCYRTSSTELKKHQQKHLFVCPWQMPPLIIAAIKLLLFVCLLIRWFLLLFCYFWNADFYPTKTLNQIKPDSVTDEAN